MIMASLGELFVELGVFADTKEAEIFDKKLKEIEVSANKTVKKINENVNANDKLNTSLKGLVKGFAGVVTAVTGAALVLNKIPNDLAQSNQALLNLTRTSDIAQGTFQKWNNIGKMLGVQSAAQQIEGLNQRLFQLMLTGEGATGFQLAGINPIGQDAEGVIEQLRARIVGMNDTAATYLLQQMGLDPQMLHLLRLSREEFEALGQTVKQYQLSPQQTKQIQAMNVQLQIASIRLKYLKDSAILAIMPAWIKLVESFARVTEGLAKFINWLNKAETLGAKVTKILLGVAAAIGVVTAAIWALTAHPIIATITAIIGLFYVLIDDVVAYMNGGGSFIGVFMKALEDFRKTGFFDDKVPEWLQFFVKAVDKVYEMWESFQQGSNASTTELLQKDLNSPYIQTVKNEDGSYGFAEVMPRVEPNLGTATQNIDNSNRTNTINMNNVINTQQPAQDIYNNLLPFANNAIFGSL